jgi:hypothetical protein
MVKGCGFVSFALLCGVLLGGRIRLWLEMVVVVGWAM